MNTDLKISLGITAAMLIAFGIEVAYIHYDRARAARPAATGDYGPTDPDDLVFLKRDRPDTPDDLKDLNGRTVWVQAGGQMDYFPVNGHHADYSKRAGTLPGAEPLKIVGVFEQNLPKNIATRVPAGSTQVLLTFTMPKSQNPANLYAAPVGYKGARGYTFFTDDTFFYDDPHKLYDWPARIWQAVDSHQAVTGMNQRQVSLALGAVARLDSGTYSDGEMVYFNADHPIAVRFTHGRVSALHAVSSF